MRLQLGIGSDGSKNAVDKQFTRLDRESASRIDVAKSILGQETRHIMSHAVGNIFHFTGNLITVQRILNGIPLLITVGLGSRALRFQRQSDAVGLEDFIDGRYGIECFGESDKGGTLVDGLSQFHRRNTHPKSRCRMGFELRQGLHRGKCRAGNEFTGTMVEVSHEENLPEDKFLENIHELGVGTLPGQSLSAKQGGIGLLTTVDTVHTVPVFLCGCRQRGKSQQPSQ